MPSMRAFLSVLFVVQTFMVFHAGCSKANTAMGKIQLYVTSVSSSTEIKQNQQHIRTVLDNENYKYEEIDTASNVELRDDMREIVGNPAALPPQLCRGDTYLGDYAAFLSALEEKRLDEFLEGTN